MAVTEAARREIRARYPQDNFLVMEGVPREDIVAEWRSNTTRENGIETARLIQGMPGKKVLLTSDFHMYRALRVFRKLGIDVIPLPIPDVLKASEHWNGRISGFQTMTAETAKIIYYKLHGWILRCVSLRIEHLASVMHRLVVEYRRLLTRSLLCFSLAKFFK